MYTTSYGMYTAPHGMYTAPHGMYEVLDLMQLPQASYLRKRNL